MEGVLHLVKNYAMERSLMTLLLLTRTALMKKEKYCSWLAKPAMGEHLVKVKYQLFP